MANRTVDMADLIENDAPIIEALRKGAREAMKRHIMAGQPMVSWEDGQVVLIPPEKLIEMLKETGDL
jgi:hypothetical protein